MNLENHMVFITIVVFLAGALLSFVANYFKFSAEFNYIRGQLSQILEIHEEFTKLVENHAKMEKDISKTFKDLDKAFLRIKLIENKLLKGGLYGTDS